VEQFKDDKEFYRVFEEFLKRVLSDPQVGPKLAKAKIRIRFNYTEPDATIFLNFVDPPPEGMFGSYAIGDTESKADVTMSQSAEVATRFWQGKLNAVMGLASGKIKASGQVQRAMGLVTAIRPTFKLFLDVLKEMGHEDKIVK